MSIAGVPDPLRNKAVAAGAESWLAELPLLVAELEREWSIAVGRPLTGGTEALVAEVTLEDQSPAVLKLLLPRDESAARNEITVLRLADGDGCVRLLRADIPRSAMLLERLGEPLSEQGLPAAQRWEVLCSAAERLWRPAPGCGLPTGAENGPLARAIHHLDLGGAQPSLLGAGRGVRPGLRRPANRCSR